MGKGTGSGTERNFYSLGHGFREAALRDVCNAVPMVFLLVLLTIELVVIQSRHQVNALLNHLLDLTVVKIHAMLDRFHARIDAVVQTLTTKRVTGDFVPSPVSLVHDSIDLFGSEGWRDIDLSVIGETKLVRRIELDPIRSMRNLIAHGFAGSPGRIHDL